MPNASYTNRYQQAKKKPTAQIAHLVFADTQANQKTKRAIFCQHSQKNLDRSIILLNFVTYNQQKENGKRNNKRIVKHS